jgi:hypothetical protein
MITRRALLSSLLPVAAGALIAPELIVPKKTIFLPPIGGWLPKEEPILIGESYTDISPILEPGDIIRLGGRTLRVAEVTVDYSTYDILSWSGRTQRYTRHTPYIRYGFVDV